MFKKTITALTLMTALIFLGGSDFVANANQLYRVYIRNNSGLKVKVTATYIPKLQSKAVNHDWNLNPGEKDLILETMHPEVIYWANSASNMFGWYKKKIIFQPGGETNFVIDLDKPEAVKRDGAV